MNSLLTETFICENCRSIINVPMYINVGRYVPMPVWCNKCFQGYKYWKFFGCHSDEDVYLWKEKYGHKTLEKD